jgi:hypothetical protein
MAAAVAAGVGVRAELRQVKAAADLVREQIQQVSRRTLVGMLIGMAAAAVVVQVIRVDRVG